MVQLSVYQRSHIVVYFLVFSEVFGYNLGSCVYDLNNGLVLELEEPLPQAEDRSRFFIVRGVFHRLDRAGDLWSYIPESMSWGLIWLYSNLLDAMRARLVSKYSDYPRIYH